jgi:hypothetical protein
MFALSTTEAKFMVACKVGRISLFVCSVLWDLKVPQKAATLAYEDNNGCTAMGNVQKPTARMQYIAINTLHFASRWNATSSILNALTPRLTLPTTSLSHSHKLFFTGMLISSLERFSQNTCLYINSLSAMVGHDRPLLN